MNLRRVGSAYGGWHVDLDLIPIGSTIISAGAGEDLSFDKELITIKNCVIIGIDPTLKAINYVRKQQLKGYTLLEKALWSDDKEVKLFLNGNPDHVSESILPDHHSTTEDYHVCESVTIPQLVKTYSNISLLKMDIEGAEYNVLDSLTELNIPQVCIEFHHFCSDKTEEDTMQAISKMKILGYKVVFVTAQRKEITFVKDSTL